MMFSATRSQAGTALLEFVLALPLLALLLLGGVEIGRYAYFAIQVGNAARAGVQYGAQNAVTALDTSGIISAAQADGSTSIAALNVTPTNYCSCWNGSSGSAVACSGSCPAGSHLVEYVQVAVSGSVVPLFHYPFLPSTLTVSNTATMRIAAQ